MELKDLTDQWFYDNGYWNVGDEDFVIKPTEKWRELMDSCFVDRKENIKILEPEELIYQINKGGHSRTNKRKKKVRPEGYLTVKQRMEARQILKENKLNLTLKQRKAMKNDRATKPR